MQQESHLPTINTTWRLHACCRMNHNVCIAHSSCDRRLQMGLFSLYRTSWSQNGSIGIVYVVAVLMMHSSISNSKYIPSYTSGKCPIDTPSDWLHVCTFNICNRTTGQVWTPTQDKVCTNLCTSLPIPVTEPQVKCQQEPHTGQWSNNRVNHSVHAQWGRQRAG